jgi:chloramphenicol O-acetyltransferase
VEEHGGVHNLVRSYRPSASQLFISLLITGLGWLSGQALSRVDQDLRIMHVEYMLGAIDLAHISADVMRYRNTIIRALETDSQKDFERITEFLPAQRAVDRYPTAVSRKISRRSTAVSTSTFPWHARPCNF